MKIIRKIYITLLTVFFTALVHAQSPKEVVKHNIATKQVVEIEVERGTKARSVEEFEAYDKNGNLIEKKDFNNDGELKEWVKYEYNEDEEVVKEIYLDEKGKVLESIVFVFKDGLKKEKLYYDSKNRLVKKKVYEYTFNKS